MATPVKYKRPSRINVVSVTLLLVVLFGGYAAYLYLPLYLTRHEAYRILEETGSKIAGRPGYYREDSSARDDLRLQMQRTIKNSGIDDPRMETWIEFEGQQVRVGVYYSLWVEWPFDLMPKRESEYELEHTLVVR